MCVRESDISAATQKACRLDPEQQQEGGGRERERNLKRGREDTGPEGLQAQLSLCRFLSE